MPLFPSKSTAISDLVLGATCLWALYALQGGTSTGLTGIKKCDSENYLAKLWFGMVLLSSAVGAFRFMRRDLFDRLAAIHDLTSWLVLVVGLPCLVSQFYQSSGLTVPGNLHLLLILPPVLSWLTRNDSYTNRVTGYIALVSTFSMAGLAIYARNYYQLLATLLMIFSSQVLNLSGTKKLGLPPVDWLHYGLAASNMLLVPALCRGDLPGMEKVRHWTENFASSMFS